MLNQNKKHEFVQYLLPDGILRVDHFTATELIGTKHKVESYRIIKKLEPFIGFETYKNLRLYKTEDVLNVWKLYKDLNL
jgi:hypothetical protein